MLCLLVYKCLFRAKVENIFYSTNLIHLSFPFVVLHNLAGGGGLAEGDAKLLEVLRETIVGKPVTPRAFLVEERVLYFSLEISEEQMLARIGTALTGGIPTTCAWTRSTPST